MAEIKIGDRSFISPILVPSVSSFETQLSPADALKLQFALQEPISLVSAFDIHQDRDLIPICESFRQKGSLLIDSGGYESARIRRYASNVDQLWSFDDYTEICKLRIYDKIFSYDYFIGNEENVADFEDRLIRYLMSHLDHVSHDALIPVVHLQSQDGERTLTKSEILHLVKVVASQNWQFVAVAERELGDGMIDRANLARAIVAQLARANPRTFLHILGCGNLLSYSFLSVAGAAMCDGLEWCRTYAADNFHLHHFQHRDLFKNAIGSVLNPALDILGSRVPYKFQVAARNLIGFQAFAEVVHRHLPTKTLHTELASLFGDKAANALRECEL